VRSNRTFHLLENVSLLYIYANKAYTIFAKRLLPILTEKYLFADIYGIEQEYRTSKGLEMREERLFEQLIEISDQTTMMTFGYFIDPITEFGVESLGLK